MVETERGFIPVEDRPLQPPATPSYRACRHRPQQGLAVSSAPVREAPRTGLPGRFRPAHERGVVVKEQGEADHLAPLFGQEDLGEGVRSEGWSRSRSSSRMTSWESRSYSAKCGRGERWSVYQRVAGRIMQCSLAVTGEGAREEAASAPGQDYPGVLGIRQGDHPPRTEGRGLETRHQAGRRSGHGVRFPRQTGMS